MPCYLFFIKFLIDYVIDANASITEGIVVLLGFITLLYISTPLRNEHLKRAILLGNLIRKVSLGFLARVLIIKPPSIISDIGIAKLINLTTGDLSKVDRVGAYYTYIIVSPIAIIITVLLSYSLVILSHIRLDGCHCYLCLFYAYSSCYNIFCPTAS